MGSGFSALQDFSMQDLGCAVGGLGVGALGLGFGIITLIVRGRFPQVLGGYGRAS